MTFTPATFTPYAKGRLDHVQAVGGEARWQHRQREPDVEFAAGGGGRLLQLGDGL